MRKDYQTDTGRAFRLSAECPKCCSPLRLRRRRADGGEFLGCTSYPRCAHAEEYDPFLTALMEQIEALERDLADARRQRPAAPATVDLANELRGLVYRWHPDRHRDPIAPHDVVAELTRLRSRVAA